MREYDLTGLSVLVLMLRSIVADFLRRAMRFTEAFVLAATTLGV